jgi:hypothetical protein
LRDYAYGLRWRGPLHTASLGHGPRDAVRLTIAVSGAAPPPGADRLDSGMLLRRNIDGSRTLLVERHEQRATFYGPPVEPRLLVHPYLGPVASVYNRWIGRESFHAGGLLIGGKAWMVLGEREAGKSTLLAACLAAGVGVLADDLCVIDDGHLLCGPRTLDLRRPPDDALAALGTVPARAGRWRVDLPDVPPRTPLAGWMRLNWGEAHSTQPLTFADRLTLLARWRGWNALPSRPESLLDLAARPGYVLTRPRALDGLDETLQTILALAR